ncbi:MAG: cytochrome c maturation protein CcmE [Myxococcales bacterium]|nr:cytochrome c maturation protein CcmE [Myxococcales bacterium]
MPESVQPVDPPPNLPPGRGPGLPGWAKIGAVFVVLAAGVGLLLVSSDAEKAFVYSKLVSDVMADPAAYGDRELRVEGELKQGSIQFREDPCEWRFVLEKGEQQMPVSFPRCVVPDTFRDGMGISVTVQGRLDASGSFLANQVVPRCPSKYEMQQRKQNGEEMPHSLGPLQPYSTSPEG